MKREYTKPEIMFESFTLSTNIAGDCKIIVGNHAENLCAYEITDTDLGDIYKVFVSGPVCSDVYVDGKYNGICYNVPIESNRLFNS